jgi:hypothetical protein
MIRRMCWKTVAVAAALVVLVAHAMSWEENALTMQLTAFSAALLMAISVALHPSHTEQELES